MLAYKVVEKKTRYSSNIAIWMQMWSEKTEDQLYEELETVLDQYNARNYILKYDIGAELYAIPGSPGIMCFRTEENALEFIREVVLYNTIIIKVEGDEIIHDDSEPIKLLKYPGDIMSLNDDHDSRDYTYNCYEDMVSFNKVTVLS